MLVSTYIHMGSSKWVISYIYATLVSSGYAHTWYESLRKKIEKLNKDK